MNSLKTYRGQVPDMINYFLHILSGDTYLHMYLSQLSNNIFKTFFMIYQS